MLWLASLAVLLAAAPPGDASVRRVARQSSNDVDNAVIEIFNDCKCVYYYQCDANNFIITSGETIINVRSNQDIPRVSCNGGGFQNEIVCCKLNTSSTTLKPIVKSPEDYIQVSDQNSTEVASVPKKVLCGAQKTIINVRIFAGEDELTPIDGEFPWIAAIFKRSSSGRYKFHCSGSLIHPKVVLTANHCVNRKKPTSLVVVINGKITLSQPGSIPEEERNVSEIVNHPNYNSGTLYNDAALLVLEEPFVASKQNYVNTLCLPPSDVNLENTKCLVAGWGKDNIEQTENKKIMKKVELPFVNFTHCQTLLRQTRLGQHFTLDKSFMCAGGEKGKDACKGDGGSPLMCPMTSEGSGYFQMGIVSWGIGCGEEHVPGVYGDVHQMAEWIRGELKARNLEIC